MRLRTCLIGLLVACSWPASAQVNLDRFLGGIIENSCRGSAEFHAFLGAVVRQQRTDIGLRGSFPASDHDAGVAAPDDVRPAVGTAVVSDEKGYTEVRVPLAGAFKGLRVAEVVHVFANGSGLNFTMLVFSSPLAAVRRTLGGFVAAGNRKLNAEFEHVSEPGSNRMEIKDVEGRPSLTCDRST